MKNRLLINNLNIFFTIKQAWIFQIRHIFIFIRFGSNFFIKYFKLRNQCFEKKTFKNLSALDETQFFNQNLIFKFLISCQSQSFVRVKRQDQLESKKQKS